MIDNKNNDTHKNFFNPVIRNSELASMPKGYEEWRKEIIALIEQAKYKAALSVNAELLSLYWNIGKDIIKKQEELGWGSHVVEQLSKDLSLRFPDDKGYSIRNLKYEAICIQLSGFSICASATCTIIE